MVGAQTCGGRRSRDFAVLAPTSHAWHATRLAPQKRIQRAGERCHPAIGAAQNSQS